MQNVSSTEVLRDATQPPSRHRLRAGIDERHPPGLRAAVMDLHRVLADIERHVGLVEVVVREVLLEHVALVAEAHHELVHPVSRVDLHDVPDDRLAADLDHRLGAGFGLLGEPRAEPSGEDHSLHHQ